MKRPPLLRSFSHAFTGMWRAVLLERNLRIHLVAMVAFCTLAAWLPVNARDWAILILTIAVVLAAEFGNTSL